MSPCVSPALKAYMLDSRPLAQAQNLGIIKQSRFSITTSPRLADAKIGSGFQTFQHSSIENSFITYDMIERTHHTDFRIKKLNVHEAHMVPNHSSSRLPGDPPPALLWLETGSMIPECCGKSPHLIVDWRPEAMDFPQYGASR